MRRTFLRRTKMDGLSPQMFFLGASVNVLGRQVRAAVSLPHLYPLPTCCTSFFPLPRAAGAL